MDKKSQSHRFQLSELFLNRADLVDFGANQHADIVFYKGMNRRDFFRMLFKNRGSDSAGSLPSSRPTGVPAPPSRQQQVRDAINRHLRDE